MSEVIKQLKIKICKFLLNIDHNKQYYHSDICDVTVNALFDRRSTKYSKEDKLFCLEFLNLISSKQYYSGYEIYIILNKFVCEDDITHLRNKITSLEKELSKVREIYIRYENEYIEDVLGQLSVVPKTPIIRNESTPEGKKFWDSAKESANGVDTWPEWKKHW